MIPLDNVPDLRLNFNHIGVRSFILSGAPIVVALEILMAASPASTAWIGAYTACFCPLRAPALESLDPTTSA